jgi:hypothetical protein
MLCVRIGSGKTVCPQTRSVVAIAKSKVPKVKQPCHEVIVCHQFSLTNIIACLSQLSHSQHYQLSLELEIEIPSLE